MVLAVAKITDKGVNMASKKLIGALLVGALCAYTLPATAGSVTLILKAGDFRLSEEAQSIEDISLFLDEETSGVFSAELEWRNNDNVSFGGELLMYGADWSSDFGTGGDLDTLALLFNVKRYFAVSKYVFPFVGAGIGVASLDFDGPGGSASASDLALQAIVGIEFRAEKVGVYIEGKYFTSAPEDDFGDEIDVTGTGVFTGLSFTF